MHLLSSKTISKRNANVHKQRTVEKGHWLYQWLSEHTIARVFLFICLPSSIFIRFQFIFFSILEKKRSSAQVLSVFYKWHEPRQLSNDIGIEEKNSCYYIVIKMYVGKLSNFLFIISLLISISFHNPKSSKVLWRADKHWCVDIRSPM